MKKLLLILLLLLPRSLSASTVDTVGGTDAQANNQAGQIAWTPVIASASGSLQSIGTNIQFASGSGHGTVAIYADSAGVPGSLLAHSASAILVTGWQDLAVTGVSIVASTKYWLAVMVEDNTTAIYYGNTSTEYYNSGYTYNVWPGTASTANSFGVSYNLRMTYAAGGGGGNARRIDVD